MNHDFETDVLIVGGGPAGAAAALSLLNYSNLKVIIIDNTGFDAVKVGEQVNSSLFELLDYLKIDKHSFEENSFIRSYSGSAAWGSDHLNIRDSIFTTQGENYQLNRNLFDLHLLNVAAEKGADIIPKTKCIAFKQMENNSWEINLKHHAKGHFSLKTKFLIDATGRQNYVCRQIDVSVVKIDRLLAIGAFLHLKNFTILKQESIIETFRYGWWYCATLPDKQITLTLFTDADIAKEKKLYKAENWNDLLSKTLHIKNRVKHSFSYSPPWTKNAYSKVTNSTLRKNFLAVGDAAASFDPISSMGIGFAISSACHAARSIIEYQKGNQTAINTYKESIDDIFKNYLYIRSQFYNKERRWLNEVFWERRNIL